LAFVYIGAFRAHFQIWDPISATIMPVVTFAILMLSHYSWHTIINKR
jgi:hypothetical protein